MTLSLQVYIPTRSRIGLNKQVTLRNFLSTSSHRPVLVCRSSEVASHRRYYDRVLGCPSNDIGSTRQWILDNSDADVVVMADDDMRFSFRPDNSVAKLVPCADLGDLLDLIKTCVSKGFIHGGLSARQGNNRYLMGDSRTTMDDGLAFVDNWRVNNFHFMHREPVLATGVRFEGRDDAGERLVMEDFAFTLGLLLLGHKNRVIYSYVWNQEASGKLGGCSDYRTAEMQDRSAKRLHQLHPEFVKLVEKKNLESSLSWKEFKVRTDVVISWMKAYEQGLKTRPPVSKRRST